MDHGQTRCGCQFTRRGAIKMGAAAAFAGLGMTSLRALKASSLPHGGGSLPVLIGRLDHGWRVRPETKSLPHAPSTYLQRFTYDTIVHSKPIMKLILDQVGPEKVTLGSDFCLDMGYEQPVEFIGQLGLNSREQAMLLSGNAERLLRLQKTAPAGPATS